MNNEAQSLSVSPRGGPEGEQAPERNARRENP